MTNYERIFQELGEIKGLQTATLEQAKKTNGRVTDLENWKEAIEVKMSYEKGFSKGRIAILSILATIIGLLIFQGVIPILASLIQH